MKIERLDLKAFGRFTNNSIDFSAARKPFHIVYGPNESGKSTSLRAITSLLYGMPPTALDNYVHPNAKMRVGGVLSNGSGSLECIRRRGRAATLRDANDDKPVDDSVLEKMLGGIDREAFEHRFGLSHEELVKGGRAILEGEGDLGEILFAAGAGVSQLRAVQQQLTELGKQLFVSGGRNGSLNQLIREMAAKKKELEELKVPPSEFDDLRTKLKNECARTEEMNSSVKLAVVKLAKLRAIQKALPLVPQWHALRDSLAELADAPQLDDAFTERRRSYETNREIATRQTVSLTDRLEELAGELRSLGDDESIMIHEAEIESLFERLGARDEARKHRGDLERKRSNMDRRMVEALQELSIEIGGDDKDEIKKKIDKSVARLKVVDSVRTKVNELAQKYAMIVQQRDDADEQTRTLSKKLTETEQLLERQSVPADPNTISQVLESVGSPDSVLSDLAQQNATITKLQSRCTQLSRKLDGFDGTFAEAAQLRLPSEESIELAAEELERRESVLKRVSDQWKQLSTRQKEQQERLQTVQSVVSLPTTEQLAEARRERDDAFCQIIADNEAGRLETKTMSRLQQWTRKADELVDAMRLHHEQLHQQASIQAVLQSIEQELVTCQSEGETVKTAVEEATNNWQALWQASGVIAPTPDRMHRWITNHAQLVDSVANFDEETQQLEQMKERLELSSKRLRRAIELASTPSVVPVTPDGETLFDLHEPSDDFASLYDSAGALRSELRDAKKRHEDLLRKRDTIRDELPEVQTRLESRQKELDQWHTDWAEATSALSENVDRTPAVVVEKVAQIDALVNQKRERDILAVRIRSIREDNEAYQADVRRLVKDLGITLPSDQGEVSDVFGVVKQLFQRMQAERSAAKQRVALSHQRDTVTNQLEEAKQNAAEAAVTLQKLCDEAGCSSPEDLAEVERRSKQRQQFETSLRGTEEQLRILSGRASLEEFAAEVELQQSELVDLDIETLEADLSNTQDQLSEAQQQVGALRHRLEEMDGSSRASELSQSIQLLAGQMENEVEQYSRVKIAAMLLQQAIDHYRQENSGPVLRLASGIFQRLTLGEYESLKVDFDARGKAMLFGVRNAEAEPDVPANAMSTGTADALYLSLRLASIDHQLSRGHALPLIVDDCMVNLDDERSKASLVTLSELSSRTQVILFTHHEHLVELATQTLQNDAFHVHRL
ncbi:hypothetical protein CA13_49710 [Planctomycetes bacterium CA13]|uniref:YhaN AAA domain-containing protein n=1 Tax=Novipirellula herctigrandis TaxID=2527986 RepID=A0A5C5Z8U3_9BACT|nr:hypothetical protein CA13_49710 [Planctomycetes bacterium CA13]